MRTQIVWIATMLLGLAALASAQELPPVPVVEVGLNYSALMLRPGGSVPSFVMQGGNSTLEFNVTNHLGLLADVGLYHIGDVGRFPNVEDNALTYMAGPRVNFRTREVNFYIQGLAGGARFTNGFDPNSPFSTTGRNQTVLMSKFGGGVQVRMNDHLTLQLPEVNYVLTRFDEPSSAATALRGCMSVSIGAVFTAGSK